MVNLSPLEIREKSFDILKPRRIDFIDQREKVIRFAEDILRAKDVLEIEQYLNNITLETEKELEIERERSKRTEGKRNNHTIQRKMENKK
jgi:hypothetical protein